MQNQKSKIKNQKFNFKQSFTLIETLIVIFVFLLLLGGVIAMILNLYQTHTFQWQQSLAIAEAKKGVELMVKEIREAREGENGAFAIEKAGDKEFIFYSDVDGDGKTERVRYFLGEIQTETFVKECISSVNDGSCFVSFSDFLKGNLVSAQLKISVQGDLNSSQEYVTIYIDGQNFGNVCKTDCLQCPKNWEGATTINVFSLAQDGILEIEAKASCLNPKSEPNCVQPVCKDDQGLFSFKAKFELTITQEVQTPKLKRGVIKPVGFPPTYPPDQEKITVITPHVRNAPPIFEYYDAQGNKIEDYPARLKDTKLMKIFLVVNVDPKRPPVEYQLESFVQLRNLKGE
jgi:type II secretory pathway pseudopilin PulG